MTGWTTTPTMPLEHGWTLPQTKFALRIGDLVFSTTGREYEIHDAVIGVQRIEGWRDAVEVRSATFQHPSGDGLLVSDPIFGARTIVLHGVVVGRSIAAVLAAKDKVAAVSGTMVLHERSRHLAREADVRKIGLSWERSSDLREFFQLTLQADDPLLYSSAVHDVSSGTVTLLNRGDATAWPVLEVSGTNALTISHADGTWTLTATPANQTRVVDLRNGDVWNGNTRLFGVESGSAPRVRPGGAEWTISGRGSGTVRVRRFEAWS